MLNIIERVVIMATSVSMLETKLSRATTRWILNKFTYNGSNNNGCFRICLDGYTEQWGTGTSNNVTFPKPFRDNEHVHVDVTSISNDNLMFSVHHITSTGFQVDAIKILNSIPVSLVNVESFAFMWKAIGYTSIDNPDENVLESQEDTRGPQ